MSNKLKSDASNISRLKGTVKICNLAFDGTNRLKVVGTLRVP